MIFFTLALLAFACLVKAVKVSDLVIYFEYPFGPENCRRYGIVEAVNEKADGLTNVTAKIFLDNEFLAVAEPFADDLSPIHEHLKSHKDRFFPIVTDEASRFHVLTEEEWRSNPLTPHVLKPITSSMLSQIPETVRETAHNSKLFAKLGRLIAAEDSVRTFEGFRLEVFLIQVLLNQEYGVSLLSQFPQLN